MMNSHEGWLNLKTARVEIWERRWVTFDGGILSYSSAQSRSEEPEIPFDVGATSVHMDEVISLRIDDQYGESTLQIATTDQKIYMRADSKDEIRLWLYCFQKSVALVLSKLLLSSSKSYPDTKQAIAQYRNNHRKMSNNIPHNDTDIFTRLTRVGSVNTVNTAPLPSVSVSSWKESEKVEVISGNLNNNTTSSSSCSDAENYREGQSKYKWISELGHGHGHTYLASRRCIYPYRENIILIDDSATLASSSSCTTENILIRYNVKSETTFENSSGSAAPLPVPDNIHLSGVNRPSIEENTGKGPVNAGGNRALYVDVDVDFEAEGVGANSNSNSNRIDSNKSNHSTGSRNVNFTDKVNIRTYSTNIFENDSYTSDVQLKEIDRGVDRDKDKSIQTSDNIGNIQVVNDFMGLSQISIPSITTTDNFSILIPVNPSATNSDTAIANSNNSPVSIPLSVPLTSSLSFGNGAGISTSLPLSIGMLHTLDSNDQERYAVRDHSNNGLEAERILSGLSLSAFPSDSYSSGCGCWGAAGMGRGVGSAMQVLSRLHSYSSDAGYCVGKGLETRSAMQYELDPGSVGCKGARDRSRSSGSIGSYDFYKYGDVTDDDTCMSDGDGELMFDFDEQQDILSAHGASLSNHKSNSNANSTTTKSRRRTLVSSSTGVGTGASTGTGTGIGTNVIITSANMDTILRSSRNITSIEGEKEGEREGEQAMKSEPDTRSVGLRWRSGICSRLGPRSSNEDRPVAISDLLEAVKLAKEEENANVEVEVCMESFIRIGVETAVLTKIDNNAQKDLDVMSGTKEDVLGLDKEVTIETWTDLSACCSSSIGTSANNDSQSVSVSDSVSVWQAVCSTSCITLNTVDFFITPELSEKVAEERSEKEKQKYDGNKCETKDDCKSHIKSERQGYFAVYDGHCGAQAAVHLQENLHFLIFNHPLYDTDVQTAIIESCVTTDRDFLAESREKKQYSGTTALGAIVRGNELTVFNIGDCHAVLCCDGVAVDMSDPHKPNRPDEAARILAAKGWITEEKELYMARLHRMDLTDPVVRDKAQLVSWVTIYRVCGEISVSRSIGDPDYKSICPGNRVDAFFLWPEGHDQVFCSDLLIPVPECRSISLSSTHEFLLIASDGLWDVVSSAEAVATIRYALSLGMTATEAAEELCDLALKLGSSDNVTAVIVQFIH